MAVDWSSGKFPQRLTKAIKNSDSVFSAWDGDRLVGLINVLSDSEMTAYIHYMLIHPDYQGQGIGKKLMNLVKEAYKNFLAIVLISYDTKVEFYQNCGFETGDDKTPMFISQMKI